MFLLLILSMYLFAAKHMKQNISFFEYKFAGKHMKQNIPFLEYKLEWLSMILYPDCMQWLIAGRTRWRVDYTLEIPKLS